MFPTASLQAVKGGNYKKFPSWAFVMLTVKPAFIKL